MRIVVGLCVLLTASGSGFAQHGGGAGGHGFSGGSGGHGYRGSGVHYGSGYRRTYAVPYVYPGYGYGYGAGFYDSGFDSGPYVYDSSYGPPAYPPPPMPNVSATYAAPGPVQSVTLSNPYVNSGGQPMATVAPAESQPPEETAHYLIAFKDHTVYAALAYWVDGKTLHYFTEGNVHNQVSLSLVDREMTARLNRGSGVEVTLGPPQ